MKIFLAAFIFFGGIFSPAIAQINAGPDITTCTVPVTLTATVTPVNSTSSYSVSSIPFAPLSYTGTPLTLGDDLYSAVIPIGFTFCFYGNTYTSLLVGSNNMICFDLANAGGYCPWPITAAVPSTANPMNTIMCPWQDLNPPAGGQISYQLQGTAPFRKFVVSYFSVASYSCPVTYTSQVILYETTNVIETHIQDKPLCATWNNGCAIHALHNSNGTQATVAYGRNYPLQWNTTNEGTRFIPAGPAAYTVNWYQGATLIGTGLSVSVSPATTTTYTAQIVYSCNGATFSDNVDVTFAGGSFTLSSATTPDSCNGSGTATVTTSGGTPPFTYLWTPSGQTTATATGLPAGNYSCLVYDNTGGCGGVTVTVNYTGPLVSVTGTNATCAAGGSANANASGGNPPYSYSWTTTPVQTTQTATGLPGGNFTVTVTDVNGCTTTGTVNIVLINAPVVSLTSTNANCSPTGSATASVTGGTPPYSYSWSTTPAQTTATATGLTAGTYSVTVGDNAGCLSTYTVTVVNNPFTLSTSNMTVNCYSPAVINLTSNYPATFSWSPATGLSCTTCQNPTVSIATTTTYTVVATSACGTSTATVTVMVMPSAFPNNLCMVTVDTATNENMVVWERYVVAPVVSFNIYKETSPGIFTVIGNQPLWNFTTYLDLPSNPDLAADRYKLSTVDTCGAESAISTHHRTIRLTVTPSGPNKILNWNFYEGYSPTSYKIWRATTPGNWTNLATLPITLNNYTDLSAPASAAYLVEAPNPNPCTPNKIIPGTSSISSSLSNIVPTGTFGINENDLANLISIFPNPSNGLFVIASKAKQVHATVFNVLGEQIGSWQLAVGSNELDLRTQPKGIYFLKITVQDKTITKKLIIQ